MMIARAFGLDLDLIKGFVAMGKGEWMGIDKMAERIGEFDPRKVIKLVSVMK